MLDARVADRVDGDAEPALDSLQRARLEVVHQDPEAQVVAVDRRVQRDRDPAVGEQLHRPDAQRLVAGAGRRAVEPGRVLVRQDRRRMRHGDDRDRQLAPRRESRIHVLGLGHARGVVDRGDAVPPQLTTARHHVVTPAVRIGVRVHRARVRVAPRAFEQQARRLAGRVVGDLAAGRIRCRPPDPERVERGRAHHALVQRVVRDHDRAVDAGRVEVGARRRIAGLALVPPGQAEPLRVGQARGLGPDRADQRGRIADLRCVAPRRNERRDGQVVVRVDERGCERAAAEVDDLGVRLVRREGRVADGRDASAVHDDDVARPFRPS